VDKTSYDAATQRILGWAESGESRYVCCANVHVVMEAQDSKRFAEVLEGASLITPDGMPLVWFTRALGLAQERVYGPDLMLHVCQAAARADLPVGLFGSSERTLDELARRLGMRFPELRIVYRHAPPFRPLTPAEDARVVMDCAASGVRVLFVALGCPKQELWMAEHVGRIHAVMIGVGAAFAFHAGEVEQAPPWMQARGLEWLFRLSREPRRLAGRYLRHNPRFVARALPALLRQRAARVAQR
jgi:N-acetylglucosaminyldiphosphoundecaprenol N-acetyl-beta-D-mannosaminyltransferase